MRYPFACLLCAVFGGMVAAATAQTTFEDVIEIDVLPGWQAEDGSHMTGLRFRLAAGWKTYWHLVGEAGIPPAFDWSRSGNLASAQIHWPHPRVFDDYGVQTIGYADTVVLPVQLRPLDETQPVRLDADAALGVCREVCLPVQITVAAEIAPRAGDGAGADAIRAALSTVPGPPRRDGGATCALKPIGDGLRVTVTLAVPDQGGRELVFIEPGRDDIWVSPPQATRTGQTMTASADLVPPEARPFALDRSALRFTVLGRDGSQAVQGCTAG